MQSGCRAGTLVRRVAGGRLWSLAASRAVVLPASETTEGCCSSALGKTPTTWVVTRGFAVPKRKVSRSKKRMKENHPTKRLRTKKTYSYCEKCDEVLGPHQICTGILKGKCSIDDLVKKGV
ncbi:putative ribosomal protein L32 [Chloropicon primus]|uniref:Putative ribosomal protein L32 n=1 Tax=Chloropicon primus TaxID=1764295 RepID=A0A5B8MLM7_9CHLO|nr:putative ribosomal protein L32 [Chloropicon primus]UPR00114.1 putative ribosomal protein L32 [Chloropicon primus]|mmetsp:Transcript_9517/g.27069  ORF Transcript_9517/g.27069 Transcript_9517/m.27069 type:complete len:121 (+) Transcript_9517:80-442(+)|eukprot:QDZ20904.1 putative ribosomal protein L32 [Chloropicon primus]